MTTKPIHNIADTWDDIDTTFNAMKMNVTDIASADASKLFLLQVDGTDVFTVDKSGAFQDSLFAIANNADRTKKVQFQVSGVTTGTTRTLNVPDFDGTIATLAGTEAFTNKTIDSANNTLTLDLSEGTLTGTLAEFNIALSDGSFASLDGSEVLTNKTIDSANNTLTLDLSEGTLTGTTAEFNTALSDDSFATLTNSVTLTNKTLTSPVLNGTLSGDAFLDEDNMASDSATKLASQQSIKAYVDNRFNALTVDDVTAVKALTTSDVSAGEIVQMAYRSVEGDGGWGLFHVLPGSAASNGVTADDALVIENTAADLTFKRLHDGIVHGEWWGFRVTSPATSDYSSIWSAMMGSMQAGFELLLPSGTFPFTSAPAAIDTSSIRVTGRGNFDTILQKNYTAGTATDYFLELQCTNTKVLSLYLDTISGTNNGYAIGCTATTTPDNDWGDFCEIDVFVSSNTNTWKRAINFDGIGKTAAPKGIRDIRVKGYALAAADHGVYLSGIQGGTIDVAVFGTPTTGLEITGDATVKSASMQVMSEAIQTPVVIDHLEDSTLNLGKTTNITTGSNTASVLIRAGEINGNLTVDGTVTVIYGAITGSVTHAGTNDNVVIGGGQVQVGDSSNVVKMDVATGVDLDGKRLVLDADANSYLEYNTPLNPDCVVLTSDGADVLAATSTNVRIGDGATALGASGDVDIYNTGTSCNVTVRGTTNGYASLFVSGNDFYLSNVNAGFTSFGGTSNAESMRIDAAHNIQIGTGAQNGSTPTGSARNLILHNGTAPSASATDGIILYAEDVTASSELKVRDEAGNVTTLSPHNFSLIGEPSEDMAWAYYSEKDGKKINVDMLKAIRVLERLSGESLVNIERSI